MSTALAHSPQSPLKLPTAWKEPINSAAIQALQRLTLYENTTSNLPAPATLLRVISAATEALDAPPLPSREALQRVAALMDALPGQAGDEATKTARVTAVASEIRRYPAPLAIECLDALRRLREWQPAPVHVAEWCDAEVTKLRMARANADRAIAHIDRMKRMAPAAKPTDPSRRAEIVRAAMAGIGKGA